MLWMSLVRPASPHKCGWQVVACLLQYSARRRPSAAKVLASTQVARSQQQEQPPAPADYEAVQLLKTIRVSHMLSNIRLRLAYLNSMAMQDTTRLAARCAAYGSEPRTCNGSARGLCMTKINIVMQQCADAP